MDRMIQGVVEHRKCSSCIPTVRWPLTVFPGFISGAISTISRPLMTAVVVEMD